MFIIINPRASGGTAMKKWSGIERSIRAADPSLTARTMNGQSIDSMIARALDAGERDFVAAGGDGTVNVLLNTLLTHASAQQVQRLRLGAIGIGSSNDFHKPYAHRHGGENISVKTDFSHATPRDVGCLTYTMDRRNVTKYFLVNASVGVNAEANLYFNNPDAVLRWLKRIHTGSAIFYAALRNMLVFRNIPVRIGSHGYGPCNMNLTNLGIVKNPHFSGDLSYGTAMPAKNGTFMIYMAHDMTRVELLHLFRGLRRGEFTHTRTTASWETDTLRISSAHPFAVEYDGEIITTKSVHFNVLQHHIKVCP